jgi:hypothetical protein
MPGFLHTCYAPTLWPLYGLSACMPRAFAGTGGLHEERLEATGQLKQIWIQYERESATLQCGVTLQRRIARDG